MTEIEFFERERKNTMVSLNRCKLVHNYPQQDINRLKFKIKCYDRAIEALRGFDDDIR